MSNKEQFYESPDGLGKISATPTPDPLSFCGDVDFSGDVPALTFLVAPESLRALLLGDGNRFLRITQAEVFSLLRLIVLNPDSSEEKREEAKSYLRVVLDNPVINDSDRQIVLELLEP
jgi:hypothetical protein